MHNGVIGAAAVMTGTTWTPEARATQAAKEAAQPKTEPKLGATMSPDLDVVKKSKGPVMNVLDEFYKVVGTAIHELGLAASEGGVIRRAADRPMSRLARCS